MGASRARLSQSGGVLHRSARVIAVVLGATAVASFWMPGAASAASASCQPGSGPPCQQSFFQIDKTTGKVVAALALPGGNKEGADYDGVDCQTGGSGHCYLAADHSGFLLMTFSSFTCDPKTAETPIGTSATFTIDAMANDPANGNLYAVVGSQLKVVDRTTGALTDTSSWLGDAAGASGTVELSHVTAMTFDPATGHLFGVESLGSQALLFKIDPATGGVVHDGFGSGLDYVTIAADGGRGDVFGIVVSGGTMYATMSLNDADPHLATVNPATGATKDVGSEGVPLVEGLTTDSSGQLFGLSGSGGAVVGTLPCPTPDGPSTPPATTPPAVSPASATAPAQVLGLQVDKPGQTPKAILPVTGSNTLPMLLVAAACFVLGALALRASRGEPARHAGR